MTKRPGMEDALKKYKMVVRYDVHWSDMDAAQHVNNLVYLRWAESARISYFEQLKLDISFQAGQTGPILGWQECKYIFPMTFPDTAIVGIRTVEILGDRFIMECAVSSIQAKTVIFVQLKDNHQNPHKKETDNQRDVYKTAGRLAVITELQRIGNDSKAHRQNQTDSRNLANNRITDGEEKPDQKTG